MSENLEEKSAFNPPKEEFEEVLKSCFTLASLRFYYGISQRDLRSYIWKQYHLKEEEFLRTTRLKNKYNTCITQGDFEHLLTLGYGAKEVADFFMKSIDEVKVWCKANYGKNIEDVTRMCLMRTRARLREAQLNHAIEGNDKIQIWLGKNLDEQKDTDKLILQKDKTQTNDIEATPDVIGELVDILKGAK